MLRGEVAVPSSAQRRMSAIRFSRAEFQAEARRLNAGADGKVLKFGPRGALTGEPGQVWKEAALSRTERLRGITWMEPDHRSAGLA